MIDRTFDINEHLTKTFGSEQIDVFNRRADERVFTLLEALVSLLKDAPDMRIPGSKPEDIHMGWMLQTVGTMAAYLIVENGRQGVPVSLSVEIFTLLMNSNVKAALTKPELLDRIRKAVTS